MFFRLLVFCTLGFLVLAPRPVVADTYLTLESATAGPIEGDVTDPGHEDTIEVFSFSQASVVAIDPLTGLPSGKKQYFPLRLRKASDAATIDMMAALDRIDTLSRFQLLVVSPSGTGTLQVDLLGASLLSVDIGIEGGGVMEETWTVAYDRIRWEDLVTGEIYEDTMQSTSIENGLPEDLARVATVPNPTSGPTEFSFRVPAAGYVSIDVFDFRGRRVARVYEGSSFRSEGVVAWNGRDDAGREIASGVYLVKMRAGEWLTTQKLTVVR